MEEQQATESETLNCLVAFVAAARKQEVALRKSRDLQHATSCPYMASPKEEKCQCGVSDMLTALAHFDRTMPPFAELPEPDTKFRIRLLQLWMFPGLNGTMDFSGVWETIELYDMGTKKESWSLRRVMATAKGQELDVWQKKIPTIILERYGRAITFVTSYAADEYLV